MDPDETVETDPAEQPVTLSAEQFSALMARTAPAPAEVRAVVDPAAKPVPSVAQVSEPLPYAFSRVDTGKYTFSSETEHDFYSNLIDGNNKSEWQDWQSTNVAFSSNPAANPTACDDVSQTPNNVTARPRNITIESGSSNISQAQSIVTGGLRYITLLTCAAV